MKKILSLFIALAMVAVMIPYAASAEGEITNLVWYGVDYFNTDDAKLAAVEAACNERLADKGLSVTLKLLSAGEYIQKCRLLCTAGEESDILWMGYLGLKAYDALHSGMIQPMETYLDEVPDLKELMSTYRNGQNTDPEVGLYAVPCLQIMTTGNAYLLRKDIVEEYDLYDEMAEVHDILDMSEFLLDVKQNYLPDNMYVATVVPTNNSRWDYEANEFIYYPNVDAYYIDLTTGQVMDDEKLFNFELEYYEIMKTWQDNGFFHPDMLTISDPNSDLWANNLTFAALDAYKPGGETDWYNRYGIDCVYLPYIASTLDTGWATCLTIPYQSTKGLEAMKLIEQVYTDPVLFNLLVNGIEGVDYEWADEGHIQQLPGCFQQSGWAVGNQFLQYPMVGQDVDIWEKTKAMNDTAFRNPLLEFAFDKSAIEAEYASVSAARSEYSKILQYGLCEDVAATLTARNEALKAAGNDAIIEELNRQLSDFLGY